MPFTRRSDLHVFIIAIHMFLHEFYLDILIIGSKAF